MGHVGPRLYQLHPALFRGFARSGAPGDHQGRWARRGGLRGREGPVRMVHPAFHWAEENGRMKKKHHGPGGGGQRTSAALPWFLLAPLPLVLLAEGVHLFSFRKNPSCFTLNFTLYTRTLQQVTTCDF